MDKVIYSILNEKLGYSFHAYTMYGCIVTFANKLFREDKIDWMKYDTRIGSAVWCTTFMHAPIVGTYKDKPACLIPLDTDKGQVRILLHDFTFTKYKEGERPANLHKDATGIYTYLLTTLGYFTFYITVDYKEAEFRDSTHKQFVHALLDQILDVTEPTITKFHATGKNMLKFRADWFIDNEHRYSCYLESAKHDVYIAEFNDILCYGKKSHDDCCIDSVMVEAANRGLDIREVVCAAQCLE